MVVGLSYAPVMWPVEMTTAVLPDPRKLKRTLFAQGGISEYTTTKAENGNTVVHGLRVFRSGTFKDSLGIQHTWEPEHMTQFVANFKLLQDKGILPNVPVRDGHPSFFGSGGEVVGYVTDLNAQGGQDLQGNDVVFLVADFEMTDPTGLEKLQNGTFRARSAEVGVYETNDEAFYWPVFMGFAFVDIPAVEGLYSKDAPTENQKYSIVVEGTEMPPAPPENPQPAPTPFQFSIGGQMVSDYAAVQSHITRIEGENATLRQFQEDAEKVARENFVKSLAAGPTPKILASQVPGLTEFASRLSSADYEAWTKTYETAAAVPAVSNHSLPAGASGDGAGGGAPADAQADEVATLQEQVKRHMRGGATQEQVEKMGSYKRLQALYAARPDLRPAA